MTNYSITLPLPPIQASPNGRFHWAVKARFIRLYRETCWALIRKATGRKRAIAGMVTIDLDFYTYKDRRFKACDGLYRPRDEDNALASAKSAIDSLTTAGVIKGDSKRYVRIGRVTLHTKQKEHLGKTQLVMKLTSENGEQ